MYTLIHTESVRKELLRELPGFALSLTLAELCFKFHSFTLECGAFLVTWYMASYIVSRFSQSWKSNRLRVGK
ncbi:MAG TPA: hypothetical protein VFQ41_07125 [Candidatus Angelobacter sp.]|nr:hypothetical protein [Candidatus Angelobacter sp.]